MIALDACRRNVLVLLLQSQNPLTAAEIASRLDMTARMVRYRLRSIERWLQARNVQVIKKPGYGILIEAPDQVKKNLIRELEHLSGYPLLLSPVERLYILILSVLTSDQPLLVKQFQHRLCVSRTTVLKDMDKVEQWLDKRNLHLIRRPHFGFKVVGRETDWREATVGLLMESVGEKRLLPLCGGSITVSRALEAGDVGFGHALSAFLEGLELGYARKLVASIEGIMNVQFTDSAYVALVSHLAILTRRVQEGNTTEISAQHLKSLSERREFAVAKTTAKRIERRFGVSLSESEIAYIATRLLTAEIKRDIADIAGECRAKNEVAPEVLEIVDGVLARASVYLHPSLKVDQELICNLMLHLKVALDQLQFDLPIRNPLLNDVKKQYPYIFEVAGESSTILGDKMGKRVPDEEIAYITMHLAAAMERLRLPIQLRRRVLVVCEAGIATAWLLVSKMRAEFPEVEIVEVISALEAQSKRDFDNIDAIVSTIPIGSRNIPSVVVSPFLSVEDITMLRQVLRKKDTPITSARQADVYESGGASLADLITDETIELRVSANSWQKVVYEAGKLLLDIGAIEARYIQAMKDVIVQHGPYMITWPGIALLHAHPRDGVRRLCMSLVTLREAVDFGHSESALVDIVVTIGAVDNRSHLRALSELQELLQNQEAVDRIRGAVHKSQVIRLLATSSREWSRPTE